MHVAALAPWSQVILAGCVAQFIKFILYGLVNRKLALRVLVTANGLPSLHGVVLSCLCTVMYLESGPKSSVYTAALVYSIIVLHDAMKVKGRVDRGNRTALFLADTLASERPGNLSWRGRLIPLLAERSQMPVHVVLGVFMGVVLGMMRVWIP